MQTLTLFAFIVLASVALIHAQNCPGRAASPNCSPQPSRGTNRGTNCQRNAGQVWAWNSRTRRCESLSFLGCGGNANRFCTQQDCQRRCQSGGTPPRTTRRTPPRTTRRTTRRPGVTTINPLATQTANTDI